MVAKSIYRMNTQSVSVHANIGTMKPNELLVKLNDGSLDEELGMLYGTRRSQLYGARARFCHLVETYEEAFPGTEATLVTAAGRTEMAGNHTDHQHGRVLAASVSMDMIACAGRNGTSEIRILQEGYPQLVLDISDLEIREDEVGRFPALVRGVAKGITDRGYLLGGFNAVVDSQVLAGSGLSSSAAYEVLIGNILNALYCSGEVTPVALAQIGQFAENVYFGKPSGLMDQMACAIGGVISIDFNDPAHPLVEQIDFEMKQSGHVLCIIDSGADHADLTDDYTAITHDMGAVAQYFGVEKLRDVEPARFWSELSGLREATNDRAVLRAIHFFEDDARVPELAQALTNGDFERFLGLVKDSGMSSARHLQNIYSDSTPQDQAVGVTIALAEHLLGSAGAVRVHGGGFAGTVQAYVPEDEAAEFKRGIEAVLGPDMCHILQVRPIGGAVVG